MIPAPILQSLISRLRNNLAMLNETRAYYKDWRKIYSESGEQENENECHARYKAFAKDISKAEVVQRALKRELAFVIDKQRRGAKIADMLKRAKAAAGEEY